MAAPRSCVRCSASDRRTVPMGVYHDPRSSLTRSAIPGTSSTTSSGITASGCWPSPTSAEPHVRQGLGRPAARPPSQISLVVLVWRTNGGIDGSGFGRAQRGAARRPLVPEVGRIVQSCPPVKDTRPRVSRESSPHPAGPRAAPALPPGAAPALPGHARHSPCRAGRAGQGTRQGEVARLTTAPACMTSAGPSRRFRSWSGLPWTRSRSA